jgi:mannose-6-phosphate isomerase-like protein (cupin superfamily)
MGGSRVVRPEPEDAERLQARPGSVQVLIDRSTGSERLVQRVLTFGPGTSGDVGHPVVGDEVLYVAGGSGLLVSGIRPEHHPLRAGTAALVRCKVPASVHNTDIGELTLVSAWSPVPPASGFVTTEAHDHLLITLHEDDQEPLPAGEDRYFKLLIQTEHVTQFVGFIDRSKAPPHTHAYEEAIYVVEGEGLLHADERSTPIVPGTSVFLPPGIPHCLENRGPGVLKVLGVFSPPGSPADKQTQPGGFDPDRFAGA